jgi:hypothetical protein
MYSYSRRTWPRKVDRHLRSEDFAASSPYFFVGFLVFFDRFILVHSSTAKGYSFMGFWLFETFVKSRFAVSGVSWQVSYHMSTLHFFISPGDEPELALLDMIDFEFDEDGDSCSKNRS